MNAQVKPPTGAPVVAPELGAGLEIRAVEVAYGQSLALHALSLEVRAGEFFCLLGPSGCGKSTLLGAIAGYLPVRSGAIHLNGRNVTGLSQQQREVGIVFQSYALFPHMSAFENIAYGLKVRRRPQAEIRARVSELISLVKLDGKDGRFPRQLSGGEQQRVAIARALAIAPRLLLLDEPLSNLDARLRDEMRVELKRIQSATGVTTVFVTHDQEEAFGLGDRIAILDKGRLEQLGTPQDIYARPRTAFVAGFIGRSNKFAGIVGRGEFRVGGHGFALANATAPAAGEHTLYLRPEEIVVDGPPTLPNRVAGRVLEIVYAGPTVTIRLATPLGEVEASRPIRSGGPVAVGDDVTVAFAADAGFFVSDHAG